MGRREYQLIAAQAGQEAPVTSVRRAVIDVGTNSVKLLVADVRGKVIVPVLEDSKQTRLGAGFYEARQLQPEAVSRTADAVAAFATEARRLSAGTPRVLATSAARDAVNSSELTAAILRTSGLPVEIISGTTEAEMIFRGVTSAAGLGGENLLLMDVGGGSTEFIFGRNGRQDFCQSFPMGALRLLQAFPPGDPPAPAQLAACRAWVRGFLQREVAPRLEALPVRPQRLVVTGGTAAILARIEGRVESYDRDRIEAVELTAAAVRSWVERLWGCNLAERQKTVGLPKSRADVILPGAVIYEGVMESLAFTEFRVSTRGLRFAAVMDPV